MTTRPGLSRALSLAFCTGLFVTSVPAQRGYDKLAPFTGVKFSSSDSGVMVEVEVRNTWSELISLDDLPTQDIVAFARRRYGARWAKRIGEDLVQVLSEMGHPPGRKVKLVLRTKAGKKQTLHGVKMTGANRQAVLDANRRHGHAEAGARIGRKGGRGVSRLRRQHTGKVDPRYEFLTRRYWQDARITPMSAEEAMQDLDQLDWHLTHTYSYLRLRKVGYQAALDTIRCRLGDGIAPHDFHIQLRKLVALFGDGHSRVRGVCGRLVPGYAPFRFSAVGDRVAAQQGDGSLLDQDHPYIHGIDGVLVARWLEAAGEMVPPGSPRFFRRQCVEYLPYLAHLRSHLGLDPKRDRVEVVLCSADGQRRKALRMHLADHPLSHRPATGKSDHRILQGRIGYLRIPSMQTRAHDVERMRAAMASFRKTKGLVIDVRGNGGGSRAALRALFPYFMRKGDAPRVVNVACFRLPPGIDRDNREGYLQDRHLYPETADVWSKAERDAIRKVARSFKPAWTPAAGEFSAWHYMVISPSERGDTYHYARPVILLIDSACFSATDIFVGAFRSWRGVTLMGTTTGGGSGRSQEFRLANSGLRVKLSTMASFRPNGEPYDGLGIEPDAVVEPTLADILGKRDSVLDAALAQLRR